MYRVLHYGSDEEKKQKKEEDNDDDIDCCLDLKDMGPPKRDWASYSNATYAGALIDEYSNLPAQEWIYHPSSSTSERESQVISSENLKSTNWLDYLNYRHTMAMTKNQRGQSMMRGRRTQNVLSSSSLSPADTYHTSRQAIFPPNEGAPLLFTFPGDAHGRQDYHYDVATLTTKDRIDLSIFEIPQSCHNRLCK